AGRDPHGGDGGRRVHPARRRPGAARIPDASAGVRRPPRRAGRAVPRDDLGDPAGAGPAGARAAHRAALRDGVGSAGGGLMQPLVVTAYLANAFASPDPWSPALEGILAYWWLRETLGEEEFALGMSGQR